jgi:hypothetical protein
MTVSMSLFCLPASKFAWVSATTSMPSSANWSLAPRLTAPTKSEDWCQTSAAVGLRRLTWAISLSVSFSSPVGVACSPAGPVVSPTAGDGVAAAEAGAATPVSPEEC